MCYIVRSCLWTYLRAFTSTYAIVLASGLFAIYGGECKEYSDLRIYEKKDARGFMGGDRLQKHNFPVESVYEKKSKRIQIGLLGRRDAGHWKPNVIPPSILFCHVNRILKLLLISDRFFFNPFLR